MVRPILAAVCAAIASLAMAAPAAAADPDPMECAVAYHAAREELYRVRLARAEKERSDSLGDFVDNFVTADFDKRIDEMAKRANSDVLAVGLKARAMKQKMTTEGIMAPSEAYFAPETVHVLQRQVFDLVHQCDAAYGFTPALGKPWPHEQVVKHYLSRMDKSIAQDDARRAALDDTQCAVRFWILAAGSAGNAPVQQAAMKKIDLAAGKVMAAQPGLKPERLAEVIQREGTARVEKLQSKSWTAEELLTDVNDCEHRYGVPLTKMNSAPGG